MGVVGVGGARGGVEVEGRKGKRFLLPHITRGSVRVDILAFSLSHTLSPFSLK
jgi:hypothetical protein